MNTVTYADAAAPASPARTECAIGLLTEQATVAEEHSAPCAGRQEQIAMDNPIPAARVALGRPTLNAELPRPLAAAARIGVGGIFLIPAALLGLVVALNPDTWKVMLNAEGGAFAWISCGLLLSGGVIATLTGLLERAAPRSERPSRWTSAAWLACGSGLFGATLDEGFRVHERVTLLLGLQRAGPSFAYIHLLLILYGLCGLAFIILIIRRRYQHCRALKALLAAGLAAYGLSMGLEALTSLGVGPVAEETLEFVAEASFLAAFYLAFVAEVASVGRVHLADPSSTSA